MSGDAPAPPPDFSNLEAELARSFQPAWAKDSAPAPDFKKFAGRFEEDSRSPGRGGDRRPQHPRRGQQRDRPRHGERRDVRGDRRLRRGGDREPRREPPPMLTGWEARFVPEQQGIDALAKQIKASRKAFPLFGLARLVLHQPERFQVELVADGGPALFRFVPDGSLWVSAEEAVAHALGAGLEQFYRREKIPCDPPKGAFRCIARCGISGDWIGPPNHHEYQLRLRRLHGERFARMSFEAFLARVEMVRDEESIQQWIEAQSSREVFFTRGPSEENPERQLQSLEEVRRDFRQHFADSNIVPAGNTERLPGSVAASGGSPAVRALVRSKLEEIRRFPLPLVHTLGRELDATGLQLFKTRDNVTWVGIARPHHLDRQNSPVAEGLGRILDFLEAHQNASREQQWEGILALYPVQDGALRERTALADLALLLHEGYVVDFAGGRLEITARQARQQTAGPAAGAGAGPMRAGGIQTSGGRSHSPRQADSGR